MNIGDKIKKRRLELNLTQDELAARLGYKNRSTVNKWEKDGSKLQQKKLKQIANALYVDVNYFFSDNNEDRLSIPVVGEVACGLPMFAEQNIIGYTYTDKKDGVDFALYAHGDSMTAARIMEGDLVYIRQQSTVDSGEIALVLVDGETATIKRFYDYGDKVVLRPESFNPEYKEQVYKKSETDVIVQGKVIFIKGYIK